MLPSRPARRAATFSGLLAFAACSVAALTPAAASAEPGATPSISPSAAGTATSTTAPTPRQSILFGGIDLADLQARVEALEKQVEQLRRDSRQ